MASNNYALLDTVGIEFETEKISPRLLPSSLQKTFSTTHDASIESDVKQTNTGIYLEDNKGGNILSTHKATIGVEIISVPLNTTEKDVLGYLKELTWFLMDAGEPEKSFRAGIHIHINFTSNLRILKSVIRLGRHLEDVFFLIGCNGYQYRGEKNDSIYTRPITKYGPPVVSTANGLGQIFVTEDLLESETISDFWQRYGDVSGREFNRYHPVRYTWLNLYSLFAHNTLEFRIFNKTLNPFYIFAEIELCRKFAEYAMSTSFHDLKEENMLRENSVFDNRTKDQILGTFNSFCEKVELSEGNRKILTDIIKRSPDVDLKDGFVLSHLRNDRRYFGDHYCPKKISSSDVRRANYVDIHVLRGETR